jgi:hypothetical protein
MIDIQTLKQSVHGKTVVIDSNIIIIIIIYLTERTPAEKFRLI